MSGIEHSIAIVGMALRFPGANTPEQFWKNLVEGRDCSRELSKNELLKVGIDPKKLDDPNYVFRSYDVDDIDLFDNRFFGMSPREAKLADPQLRFLLETVYECIEDSGHDLLGENVGLYVGSTDNKYWLYHKLFQSCFEAEGEIAKRIFTLKDYFATQVSHKFDLTGPSISMNSACSTGILATHEACNHLLMFDCDYALAGGCEILKGVGYRYQEGGLSSRDGYVRAFDANASGTTFGSGVGIVLLRRLSDALEDNDHIYAVIKSTAVNNDGNQKVGYMAPGVRGQMGVIRSALARADVSARNISYVETHGTGTPVGDPIEIESLSRVYRKYTEDTQYCAIGSVKTNVGHLSIAAGIAGLIKTALMLRHKKIPASLNFSRANPAIDFCASPFYVNRELRDWDASRPRLAGVSAFGVGGTNTHAILQEAPERVLEDGTSEHGRLIVLSSKCEAALEELRKKLAGYLQRNPNLRLGDLSYTLNAGRPHYSYRCHTVADNIADLVEKLGGESNAKKCGAADIENLRVAFMFPGQGSQYVNMGRELYEQERVFAEAVDACFQSLDGMGINLSTVLYPDSGNEDDAIAKLGRTEFTQLGLFVVSYALARLFIHWGISPSAMVGHSIGEYVAACLAGVFSLEDGLKLVSNRGRLMQSMPAGSMLSIPLGRNEVARLLPKDVSIAGENGPSATVVSGPDEDILSLQDRLFGEGIKSSVLHTSHAFHSVMMEPILEPYRAVLAEVELKVPKLPFVSNVSGTWISDAQAVDPDYWVLQLRQEVRFSKGIETLLESGHSVLLEVGPGATLSSLAGQQELDADAAVVRSMRRATEDGHDATYLLDALGALWCAGKKPSWDRFYEDAHGVRIPLPTYPFQRKRYWLEDGEIEKPRTAAVSEQPLEHPLLGRRIVSTDKVVAYENYIDRSTPAYIVDHRLVETTIFPGAGFTQMALAVGRLFVKNKKIKLDEIRFAQALMLPEGMHKVVQIIATAREPYGCTFEIISRTLGKSGKSGDGGWALHAKGALSAHSRVPEQFEMPGLVEKPGSELIPLDLYYDALKFITFGPSFRAVRRMWIGENESVGWVKLPEHLKEGVGEYSFHPVMLDAAFQVIDGPKISESGTLPVGLKNLVMYGEVPEQFYVAAKRQASDEEEFSIGEITVFSDTGTKIAHIEHYLQKEITDSVDLHDRNAGLLYELNWCSLAEAHHESSSTKSGAWAVIGPAAPLPDMLVARNQFVLRIENRIVREGERFTDSGYPDRDSFDHDKRVSAELLSLLAESRVQGIVFAKGLADEPVPESLCLDLLELVRWIGSLDLESPPSLSLVTRGAQHTGRKDPSDAGGIAQAALWGMGNTITVEHPELRCVRIDLGSEQEAYAMLVEELIHPGKENQLAFRDGTRYVPRLEVYGTQSSDSNILRIPNGAYEIRLTEFGTFDKLVAREVVPDILEDVEVHVEMYNAALNFKETLYVLGFLNPNQRDASDIDFGMEGAGRIKKVGGKITHLKPGDDVIVWHNGCLRSDFVVNANRVIRMPDSLKYSEAACLPTVFMTAYYALFNLAGIKRGDRILIHACAGGVGQVALQIAQNVGAEVFATASEAKWSHLKSQGVEYVMNSRSLDFADEILDLTDGEGVDIVLNSLAGDYIQKSFDVLRANGRFVEIGKKEIWTTERAKDYRPDVDYQFFEIGEDVVSGGIGETSIINELMTQVLDDFAAGRLKPLPMTRFLLSDLSSAFRYLSAGKNIGKVVVDLQASRNSAGLASTIRDDRTYLVTGGLGALGFLSANWLIKKGARHLVLTGRSGPNAKVRGKLEELREAGVGVSILQGDVAMREDLQRIFEHIDRQAVPLGGILHCAGVLQDGVLLQLTEDRFVKCLRPKVQGSWYLHELTKDRDLDFFVCFSSVSAILDGGGQGNYAAANAFMDRLASYRRDMGLPALSVNWGGWADVGMAAKLLEERGSRSDDLLSSEDAFAALERVMVDGGTQAVICKLGSRVESGPVQKLLENLAQRSETSPNEGTELEGVFRENPANSTNRNMEIFVSRQVGKVLGVDSGESIDLDEEFADLGVDSLSMTELRNAVQRGLGKTMKMATFFANSSVKRLADHLAKEYGASLAGGNGVGRASGEPEPHRNGGIEFVSLAESAGTDIFCFPGLNGNVFDYSDFAEANGEKFNTRVGQFIADPDGPETDIRKIAAGAIAAIREIQPDGPYSLMGYSYGGVVALETAHQLIESGDEVQFVMMIDTFPHFEYADDLRFRAYMAALIADSILTPMALDEAQYERFARRIIESPIEELADFMDEVNGEVAGYARLNPDLLRNIVVDGERRTKAFYRPPSSIPGLEIQFVRAGSQPASVKLADVDGLFDSSGMAGQLYGWDGLVDTPFKLTRLQGHHNSLLKKEHLAEVSQIVESTIDANGSRERPGR